MADHLTGWAEIGRRNGIENGWLQIGRIFLVERTEVEPFDRNAEIEWNAVEFYRIYLLP